MSVAQTLTVDDYEAMVRDGRFVDVHVELLDGVILRKMTKGPLHNASQIKTAKALRAVVPPGWDVWEEKPLRIPPGDEPEPDVMVVRGSEDDYLDRPPGPADVALVVEVADSGVADDRRGKRPLYARAGVPAFWLLDVKARALVVHREPKGGDYTEVVTLGLADEVAVVVDGREVGRVAVRGLFGHGAVR